MTTPLEIARQFAALGVDAFPAKRGAKHPFVRWQQDWGQVGKHPTDNNLRDWFETGEYDVWVRACSSYVVIDCDNEASSGYWLARLGALADTTTTVKTTRGLHIAFAVPNDFTIPNWNHHDGDLSHDIRGSTGNSGVIVPPAADGREWIRPLSELVTLTAEQAGLLLRADQDLPHAPSMIAREQLEREVGKVRRTPPGGRNDQLNRSAFALGRLVASGALRDSEVRAALADAAADAGMDEREDGVSRTIESGLSASPRQPRKGSPTTSDATSELGNAERFVRSHGHETRYVRAWKRWLLYNGRRWQPDDVGAVEQLMKHTVRSILTEAWHEDDDDKRRRLAKWGTASESAVKITNALRLAQTEPPIAARADQFDRDPTLLSVGNGTLDLTTGLLRPDDPNDLITTGTDIDYDPGGECPKWLAFIRTVTRGDEALAGYLQRAVGYTLTGHVSEQSLFFLHGVGANGKSTFERVLAALLGGYAVTADPELLLAKDGRYSAHPTSAAALRGKRLAICSEIGEGKRFAEVTVKQLTGGDTIAARFMHQDFFNFEPTHKFWIAANHRPGIRGTDDGIWRRIRLIGFHAQIPEGERIADYHQLLLDEEAPGILQWAVEGALAWQRQGGLGDPEAVVQATHAYRQDEDRLGMFIEEYLEWDPDGFVSTADLAFNYEQWAKQENVPRLETKALRAGLIERADSLGLDVRPDKRREGQGRASVVKRGLSGLRLRDRGWLRC